VISWWFLWTLCIVAIVSAVLEVIGMAIVKEYTYVLSLLISVMGGAVTGLIVNILGPDKGVEISLKTLEITGLCGMVASAIGELAVIIIKNLPLIIKIFIFGDDINDINDDEPPQQVRPTPMSVSRWNPEAPRIPSEKRVIEQSFRKKTNHNRIAYISLFLALAEEIIKALLQDTPIVWAIVTAVLLILSFLNQRVLDYRGERDLYGASYSEAKETVTHIVHSRRTSVNISQRLVFTKAEMDRCLQVQDRPDKKLDKADKASNLLVRAFNILLLYNPQKTGIGVLLGVVCHTVYENVMRFTEIGVTFSGLTLPIYFWIALGVLALNFRNPFAYRTRTGLDVLLGILFGVTLHTVSENVMRFTDLDLTLPLYFWIALGVLVFIFRNPFARRSVNRELETRMSEIKKAQRERHFTESEKRQQWRNFIALANQKAS